MKLLVSAIALLIGSNVAAMAGDQALKFKLVTFYVGEKDGGYHMVGVTVAPDGSLLGTKDFMTKEGPDGKGKRAQHVFIPRRRYYGGLRVHR